MGIQLNDNINLFAPKSLDARYGPWTSTTEANSGIISANRYIGLTISTTEERAREGERRTGGERGGGQSRSEREREGRLPKNEKIGAKMT